MRLEKPLKSLRALRARKSALDATAPSARRPERHGVGERRRPHEPARQGGLVGRQGPLEAEVTFSVRHMSPIYRHRFAVKVRLESR